jgi:hypothetical protein
MHVFIGRIHCVTLTLLFTSVLLFFAPWARSQQTLGGISGTVTDASGSAIPGASVTVIDEQTHLTRISKTHSNGSYEVVNLPIGSYIITVAHEGFSTAKYPGIRVQGERTVSLTVPLQIGSVSTSVTVEASPLLNAVDTTNGYVLDKRQIEAVPLATGSFTQLAILAPGVSAELLSGTDSSAGLGNQAIWANGQRDTSNTFQINGVDVSNLFNGKSTSDVASSRVIQGTGQGDETAGGTASTNASIYLSIGQALPTPPQETIEEVRVNTSMYDAQQGSTSGAHIDLSTASGTNTVHGETYLYRGTDWLNAAPFFFKQDPNIPANEKVPELHRYTAGVTEGGPLIKNKLFGFVGYHWVHVSDEGLGISRLAVPPGLTDDRSAGTLATLGNTINGGTDNGVLLTTGNLSPIALTLMQYKFPDGQYLIPSANGNTLTGSIQDNASIPGTARFSSKQVVADLDWNASPKDVLSTKYYYQHDPSSSPFAYSYVAGFTQDIDAGGQVASINNALNLSPSFNWTQTLGFARENEYSGNEQPFSPSSIGIDTFGYDTLPGISIGNLLGNSSSLYKSLDIGPTATKYSFTGMFQNRVMPSTNAIWIKGRHNITFGSSYSYTQLNVRNNRTDKGYITASTFSDFLAGTPLTSTGFFTGTSFLQGDANRYYRANQVGTYLQDKFSVTPRLSLTAGIRYDWNGPLVEKYGRLFNFDPSRYNYSPTAGEVPGVIGDEDGFVIAGNNKQYPTAGVSASTLTGRQWGFAPRLGFAYSPERFNNKLVVRGGLGIYYDRGELFAYFSPASALGTTTGGPFGVTQAPPWVSSVTSTASSTLANPWGTSLPAPPTGNPADIVQSLPNAAAISEGARVFSFAGYDPKNRLPYTINYTFDVQWQPRNDLAIDIGYVGNLGRHEVIPIPFNQAQIATSQNPVNGQSYTYGYNALDSNTTNTNPCTGYSNAGYPLVLPNGQTEVCTYEGGNIDLRVPYIGYGAESVSYRAVGISSYSALQAHLEKRLSHGLQAGVSYTFSHALDEQSALGTFYNGNNPLDLRGGYASSDFDRTHIINFNYSYQLPRHFGAGTLKGRLADGWGLQGLTVIQSGQPYSVLDFTGAVASIYYSVNDGITSPILPLAPGYTPKTAKTGKSGAFGTPALNPNAFTIPSLSPGEKGVPPCGRSTAGQQVCDIYETDFSSGQRNDFRQSFQKRADISLVKTTQISEHFSAKYAFNVFNLTNTSSFDIPGNFTYLNASFNQTPTYSARQSNAANFSSLYGAPAGLGYVTATIGNPRQIQMSLHVVF